MNNVDEEFRINDFSPNDEGPAAPLHIFEHHGIKPATFPSVEPVDEAMTEEEEEGLATARMSITAENPNPSANSKTLYFGGFSLLAPS